MLMSCTYHYPLLRINTLGAYLISPAIGAHFTMYLANMQGDLFVPFARTLDRNMKVCRCIYFLIYVFQDSYGKYVAVHLSHVAQGSICFAIVIIQQVSMELIIFFNFYEGGYLFHTRSFNYLSSQNLVENLKFLLSREQSFCK